MASRFIRNKLKGLGLVGAMELELRSGFQAIACFRDFRTFMRAGLFIDTQIFGNYDRQLVVDSLTSGEVGSSARARKASTSSRRCGIATGRSRLENLELPEYILTS
ncbi:hypothetical protein Tco_0586644 [Tanacetum coccineum]|uniref:Uncharacterized protein n=1 Tax=Tanacetum coccineum TaxID=301880 RepID=A0ABQ5DD41_9ASTR